MCVSLLAFSLVSAYNQDKQWKVNFGGKKAGSWNIDGEQGLNAEIKLSGYLYQYSSGLEDIKGRVNIYVKEGTKTKVKISFSPRTFSSHGIDQDGTYYVYGDSKVIIYNEEEYERNGKIRTRRTRETLKNVPIQLSFNPYTNYFEVATTTPKIIVIMTSAEKMKFTNYRGFDCGYEYADSFDGIYEDDEWICRNGFVYKFEKEKSIQNYRGNEDLGTIGNLITTTDEGYEVKEFTSNSANRIYVWYKETYTNTEPNRTLHHAYQYERSPEIIDLSQATHII